MSTDTKPYGDAILAIIGAARQVDRQLTRTRGRQLVGLDLRSAAAVIELRRVLAVWDGLPPYGEERDDDPDTVPPQTLGPCRTT